MSDLSIVFFGTGPVAADSLKGISGDFNIELVITKPKAKNHRYPAPVEELSKNKGYRLSYATSTQEINNQIAAIRPRSNVAVVIDFGLIIPQSTLDYFKYGIINSHFSLLPRWRGADPITFAILNGDEETGVSLMKIVDRLDEGPLIAQNALSLSREVDQSTLTRDLIKLSDRMLAEYLPKYVRGEIRPEPQSLEGISYSRKISKEDGKIDWQKPAEQIEREIRAYLGWPKSRAYINDIDCIILKALVSANKIQPGRTLIENNRLLVGCGGGSSLDIQSLQPAGKKQMTADEFIRGYIR